MARLTLRLPQSLHQTLNERAEQEGVSMNQYLVYLLARSTAVDSATKQQAQFQVMSSRVSDEQAEASLAALLAGRDA